MSARDRITAEALKLFVRQGVSQTTTREIAAAAGIAEGTIYRHFKSKDELAETLFERNYLAFAGYLERASSRAASPAERLARMVSWLSIAAERDADLFAYLFLAEHGLASRVRADAVTPLTLLRDAIAAVAPGRNADFLLSLATGALFGVVRARRAGSVKTPLTDQVQKLVAAVQGLVGADSVESVPVEAIAEDESAEDMPRSSAARHLVAPAEAELAD